MLLKQIPLYFNPQKSKNNTSIKPVSCKLNVCLNQQNNIRVFTSTTCRVLRTWIQKPGSKATSPFLYVYLHNNIPLLILFRLYSPQQLFIITSTHCGAQQQVHTYTLSVCDKDQMQQRVGSKWIKNRFPDQLNWWGQQEKQMSYPTGFHAVPQRSSRSIFSIVKPNQICSQLPTGGWMLFFHLNEINPTLYFLWSSWQIVGREGETSPCVKRWTHVVNGLYL